jgi:glycine/D-amino acid oxidase-like deaminating enzyme
VVGAGVAGLSVVLELALHGDDGVVLVDRRHPGAGASTRNAGFVLADSECLSLAAAMHGEEIALALHEAGLATRRSFERIAHRFADPESVLRVTGSVRLANDDEEAAHFRRTVARGLPGVRLEDPSALAEAGRAGGWTGALVDEGDAVTDPVLVVALACALAQSLGVRRFDDTPVSGISRRAGGAIEIDAPRGRVLADRVIVATNAEILALLPEAAGWVRPVRAQSLAARVDPVPVWTRPTYAARGGDYWRLLPDGRVFLGGLRRIDAEEEETVSDAVNPRIHRRLDALLARLVAPGARIAVTHRWAGTMGFTPDGAPLVGAVPGREGVHLLAGWNGHGMGWAPGLAGALAASLQDRGPPPPSVFRPGRNLGAARPAS